MEAHLRPEDVAARLDDDLFGLFFPDTSESDAAGMVEAIRTRLALPALGTRSDGAPLRVQPAAGVVAHSGDAVTEDELLTRVLRALKGAESIPVGTTQAWSMLSAQPGT
jgi:GGDEF domain-containing protein